MEQFLKFLAGLLPVLFFICGAICAICAIAVGDFVSVAGIFFLAPFTALFIKYMRGGEIRKPDDE